MNEKQRMMSTLGLMFGLEGFLVLLYPNRSPIATQMYIAGSMLVLIMNFVYTVRRE